MDFREFLFGICICLHLFQVGSSWEVRVDEDVLINGTDTKMEEKFFEQYLNHFDVWDNRTFPVRYFEVNEFFRPGGPLFIEIGSESTLEPDTLQFTVSYDLVQKLHGKLVLLEHRYYGKSAPTKNFTAENLVYLTVDQALEDLAYFIESYKKSHPGLEGSKVAVFGCSYAASLATWIRYKFPHLVDAAWASSAPLRTTLDFYEYYETAGEVYSNVSTECIAIIRQGYREAKQLLNTSEGLEEIRSIFQDWECGNVTEMSANDILTVIRMVVSNQYSPAYHGMHSCTFLQSKNETTTPFQQLAEFVLSKAEDVCLPEDPDDDLAWTWQSCTEFGYSFTTSSVNQPFRDDYSAIESDLEMCRKQFGEEFNLEMMQRNIDRMNRVYGSVNLQATRVLSVHGTNDPWRKLGLYYQKNQDSPVILIPETSHCSEQMQYDIDVPQIREARRKGMEIMARWLQ